MELKCEVESEGMKCQFSQVEGDLDLQENSKFFPIPNKRAPRKKVVMVKER
jgi:hypothetical protein